MTAQAQTLGKRNDGTVRRYGLETRAGGARLLHVLATKTGALAYCGYRPAAVLRPPLDQAISFEQRTAQQTRGFLWCRRCLDSLSPQPDPAIWKPK